MKSIIVGVAFPRYTSPVNHKELVKVNAVAKGVLLGRFPGAKIVYDGRASGASKSPNIAFYAKLPADSDTAVEMVKANGGKRPTVSRGFAGAYVVTVDANGLVNPALDSEVLATKTLKELIAIGAERGIKIASGMAKAAAIARLLA